MFGKIFKIFTKRPNQNRSRDKVIKKIKEWLLMFIILVTVIGGSIFLFILFGKVVEGLANRAEDGTMVSKPDIEKTTQYLESNEEIIRILYPDFDSSIGTIKLCYINELNRHIYYLKDNNLKVCRIGYGANWQFHLDTLRLSFVETKKLQFDDCLKLDL